MNHGMNGTNKSSMTVGNWFTLITPIIVMIATYYILFAPVEKKYGRIVNYRVKYYKTNTYDSAVCQYGLLQNGKKDTIWQQGECCMHIIGDTIEIK